MYSTKEELPAIFLTIPDLRTEHCALLIEQAIAQVSDVSDIRVEVNNKRVGFRSLPEKVSEVVHHVRQIGYHVLEKKGQWNVMGMSCASCAVSVESIVMQKAGVLNASVNYASNTLSADYLPGIVSPVDLKNALMEAGYDLLLGEGGGQATYEEVAQQIQQRYQTIKRRAWTAMAFAIPLFVIGMFFMHYHWSPYATWLLATPLIFWLGREFFINSWKLAKNRTANMDTLVALSTGTAYVYSVFNTVAPSFWESKGLHPHIYFEAAGVVVAFILFGKWLEERAKKATSEAISQLIELQPQMADVLQADGSIQTKPISALQKGELILAKAGERIAVDGEVVSGFSNVDESLLSGEPMPVTKKAGDFVYAGTINQQGTLQYKAMKIGQETMLADIIRMVQEAQGSKAPVQKMVDKIAAVFVPAVLAIALITAMVWIGIGGVAYLSHGVMAMVTVLVIACPCALGLATPTALMVGIGKAAKKGILIKDAQALELACRVDALVLDKTGTLTQGKPAVTEVKWFDETAFNQKLLVSLERASDHPLAKAILSYFQENKFTEVTSFENHPGLGTQAIIEGKKVVAGNEEFMHQNNITIPESGKIQAETWKSAGKSLVWFGVDKNLVALLAIEDPVKEGSREAIQALKKAGIQVHMLTGDHQGSAERVAKEVDVEHILAHASPAQKLSFVRELQNEGKIVGMVGDGINDSAALAHAQVSIAMGGGSDIARESAQMTILSSDLRKIPEAIILSRKTVATIKQNLFWAFIYNVIGIPIAAGVLFPMSGFLLDPMIAGAAMALSSVSVVSNSLRLKWSV
jgi:P-type Cu2+ transporter